MSAAAPPLRERARGAPSRGLHYGWYLVLALGVERTAHGLRTAPERREPPRPPGLACGRGGSLPDAEPDRSPRGALPSGDIDRAAVDGTSRALNRTVPCHS